VTRAATWERAAAWSGGALVRLALVLAVAACGSASTAPLVETIDGFAIGDARTVSPEAFHRLEVTAREAARTVWPETILTGVYIASAGRIADGSIQADTEGPLTFLVVVDLRGGARHALVLRCDDGTFPDPESCTPTR
jgi:hypothetical protein